MIRNDELIDQVMGHLREHPQEWNQSRWVSDCGTQMCFAGHAMLMSGYTIRFMEGFDDSWPVFIDPQGVEVPSMKYSAVANDLLGLSVSQGNAVYYGLFEEDLEMEVGLAETMEDLEELIAAIRDGRIV